MNARSGWLVMLILIGLGSDPCQGAVLFSTQFDPEPLHGELEDVETAYSIASGNYLPGSVIRMTTFIDNLERRYVRTVDSDYNNVDFIYEITFRNTGDGISYVGLGEGTRRTSSNEPGNAVFWRVSNSSIEWGWDDGVSLHTTQLSATAPDTDYRARIIKTGDLINLELDVHNDGTVDYSPSTTIDIENIDSDFTFLSDPNNGALFFGTARVEREFDDFSVYSLGNMNGDDAVDLNDIDPFVLALTDRAEYDLQYPSSNAELFGDVNRDGVFNLRDLNAFSALFEESPVPAQAVPEPSTFALLVCFLPIFLGRRRCNRQPVA